MNSFRKFAMIAPVLTASLAIPRQVLSDPAPLLKPGDTVVLCGDSITCNSRSHKWGYVHQITNALAQVSPNANYTFKPLGFCGNTVESWISIEANSRRTTVMSNNHSAQWPGLNVGDALTNRVDALVVSLGMNDVLCPFVRDTDESMAKWKANYRTLINHLRERAKPRIVLISTVPPLTNDPDSAKNRVLARMDAMVRELAREENVLVVDYQGALAGALAKIRARSPDYQDTPDFVHPRELGNLAMGAELCRSLGEKAAADFLDARFAERLNAMVPATPAQVSWRLFAKSLNTPNADQLSYEIEWFRIGDDTGALAVELPDGWKADARSVTGRNGKITVTGSPKSASNVVKIGSAAIAIPAPWRVSAPFDFPAIWHGQTYLTNAPCPVAVSAVGEWRLTSGSHDYLGALNPWSIDYMQSWFGMQKDSFYAMRKIWSDKDREVRATFRNATFSGTFGFHVFLDGAEVAVSGLKRGKNEAPPLSLKLKQGWNELIIRCDHSEWQRQFSFELQPAEGDTLNALRFDWK